MRMRCVAVAAVAVFSLVRGQDGFGATPYPWPQTIYEDQFEYQDLSRWRRFETGGGGEVAVDTSVRHSGRQSARCSVPPSGAGRVAYLLCQTTYAPKKPQAGTLHVRAYLYFDVASLPDAELPVMGLCRFRPAPDGSPEPDLLQVLLRRKGGRTGVSLAGSDAVGTTAIEGKRWYCIEVKVTAKDGTGEAAVFLDGREQVSAQGLSMPALPDGVSLGFLKDPPAGCGGAIFVDDLVVDDRPAGPDDCSVRLAHPCFIPRSGARVIAILTGDRPTDRLTATFSGSNGMRRTVYRSSGPLGGLVDFSVDLTGLPAGTYTLTVDLSDAAGRQRAAARYTYEKPFDGVPEFSIDADNNILWNGKKFFPVTSFGLRRTLLADWLNNRYCNLFYGMEWMSDPPGVPGYRRLLDAVREAGGKMVGPAHDYRFDRPPDRKKWTPEAVEEYLRELGNHPAVAWWMWREEPVNWKYPPESQKLWWDLVKRHDPKRMVEILEMGACYQIGLLKAQQVYLTWPFFAGDIYSWDIYPIENEKEPRGSFVDYAQVADRAVAWNMGLVPVIPNVATADVTPGKRGGTPTPQEIFFVCWLSIVHGARGIHWYPYQGTVPPENYRAMAKFVEDTTILTDAILGKDLPGLVSTKVTGRGRIDVRATMDSRGDLWLFAVNVGREPEAATFTLHPQVAGLRLTPGADVAIFGENRTLTLDSAGSFTDSFDGIAVHIYRIAPGKEGDAVRSRTHPSAR